jgi:hypothetical protein
MPNPHGLKSTLEYRNFSLQIAHTPPQWTCLIVATSGGLPEMAVERQTVRGWDKEEVVKRAKSRVDDMLATRHSN